MAKKRCKQTPKDLPGSLYQRNGRWWWKVRLPGEEKTKACPLKPIGSRCATTDYAVAVECARQLVHFGHHDIHQDKIEVFCFNRLYGLFTVQGIFNFMVFVR